MVYAFVDLKHGSHDVLPASPFTVAMMTRKAKVVEGCFATSVDPITYRGLQQVLIGTLAD
jgi:hypothetical protein